MASATINGHEYNDDPYEPLTNPGGFPNGGHASNFVPALADVVVVLGEIETAAMDANVAKAAAQAAAASASAYALGPTTSSSSHTIGTGSKVFVLAAALSIVNGAMLRFTDAANSSNWMTGLVTSGGGTTSVTATVATFAGSGTKTSWVVQVTGADGVPASGFIGQGLHTIVAMAGGMVPRQTNGPAIYRLETTTNKVMVVGLAYDASTVEYAQAVVPMVKSWNASTVTIQFGWMAPSGTGNVVWAARATSMSDDDPLDTAFGTAVTVTDGITATGDLMITSASGAMTIGNTPAKSDHVVFEFYRDAANGSDTFSADAILLWAKIFLSIDAQTDT